MSATNRLPDLLYFHIDATMAIFVTGGYGHIGSWTALLLARQGQDIIVYDTNDDAPDCLTEVANRITFIKGDVLTFTTLREAFEHHHTNIDGVVHTVATMGEFVEMDPHQNVNLNVMGLVNVLEIVLIRAPGGVERKKDWNGQV